ncbi:MAG: hypothetical protein AAF721_35610, partial [Myxococcota bacterium]
MADIALVTEGRLTVPVAGDWFVENVFAEDRIVEAALRARGLSCVRVDWADPAVEWGAFGAAVLRTTWDYFDRPDAFRAWLARVESQTRLINDAETVRWNMDKHYLAALQSAGVAVVPTVVLERGDDRPLGDVMAHEGWDDVVLKPAVSGAGRHTYRVQRATLAEHESIASGLLQQEAMMVQPFVADVLERGEVTVVAIEGEPTHALCKRARPGEFRVQDDYGGTLHDHEATPDEL